MDHSVCEALCKKHLSPLAEFLSIGHWRITTTVGECKNPDHTAECSRNAPYDIAEITIDPRKFDDEDFFLDTLYHELIHIVLAPFDLYRTYFYQGFERESTEDKREDLVWAHSCEKTVINMERLWRRHLKSVYLSQISES